MLRHDLRSSESRAAPPTPIVHALREGAVVVLPTDTIYGFSARYDRPAAVQRIAEAKGREDPFLLLVPGIEMVERLAGPVPRRALELVWPGPVTLLLHARPGLPPAVVSGRGTVAIRWPSDPWLGEVLRQLAVPVVSTSVNRSGEPPLEDPELIARRFATRIDVLVDAGPITGAAPSVIIDTTRRPLRLLRGDMSPADLETLQHALG